MAGNNNGRLTNAIGESLSPAAIKLTVPPVCIVMALRKEDEGTSSPARVRYCVLPLGHRDDKFAALGAITLDDSGWVECSSNPRVSFFPRAAGEWADFAPPLSANITETPATFGISVGRRR